MLLRGMDAGINASRRCSTRQTITVLEHPANAERRCSHFPAHGEGGGTARVAQCVSAGAAHCVCDQARHLMRMLRPELVKSNPTPLSSDAYTFFGIIDARQHNHA